MNGKNGVNPQIFLNDYGKVLVVPMNHKRRKQLVNFLNILYSEKRLFPKSMAMEVMDGCYMVMITDLKNNNLKKAINEIVKVNRY